MRPRRPKHMSDCFCSLEDQELGYLSRHSQAGCCSERPSICTIWEHSPSGTRNAPTLARCLIATKARGHLRDRPGSSIRGASSQHGLRKQSPDDPTCLELSATSKLQAKLEKARRSNSQSSGRAGRGVCLEASRPKISLRQLAMVERSDDTVLAGILPRTRPFTCEDAGNESQTVRRVSGIGSGLQCSWRGGSAHDACRMGGRLVRADWLTSPVLNICASAIGPAKNSPRMNTQGNTAIQSTKYRRGVSRRRLQAPRSFFWTIHVDGRARFPFPCQIRNRQSRMRHGPPVFEVPFSSHNQSLSSSQHPPSRQSPHPPPPPREHHPPTSTPHGSIPIGAQVHIHRLPSPNALRHAHRVADCSVRPDQEGFSRLHSATHTTMADETTTAAAPVDAPVPAPAAAAPVEAPETTTKVTNGDAAVPKENGEGEGAAEPTGDGNNAKSVDDSASAEPTAATTPASAGKDKKRKSTGGVPEHKGKKAQGKRKSMPANLNLDAKPGEFYWARLKGYPPWPSIICDESMLPEVLLASRPVSTSRPDGSIRDDFLEGGKNARDRTYPIMFLHTNEFIWMNNTLLTPLDPEECKTFPNTKMTKALQLAYKIASENHDLDYFKDLLATWQTEMEAIRKAEAEDLAEWERQQAEQAAAEEAGGEAADVKPKKKAARKSKGADDDVPMDDGEAAPKSTKKRKKAVDESEGDAPKAKKTPKVTKLNGPKTPSDASAKKEKEKKPKKKVVTAPKIEEPDESKPELTPKEKLEQREKSVLYLRHRLQKGFLSRDTAPKEDEMANMADFFGQLEAYTELEPSIIRITKIHKVLKAIVKLTSVPKDEEHQFKKRSSAMLEIWNKRMEGENDAATSVGAPVSDATEAKAPETNGHAATKDAEMKDVVAEAQEGAEKQPEKQADAAAEEIEEKVEGKADAVADLPAAPTEKIADLAEAAKEEAAAPADADVNMEGAAA